MKRVLLLSLAVVGAIANAGHASLVPVTNYNFSDPIIPTAPNGGYYIAGVPTGWSSTSSFAAQYYENAANGGFASSGTLPAPPGTTYQPGLSGPNYQYVADDGQGTLYQNLGVPFKPNTTYTVDISGGNRNSEVFGNNTTTFGLISSLTSIPGNGSAPATLPGATTGFFNEYELPEQSFVLASTLGPSIAEDFTFTTGSIVPAGNVEVYMNSDGTGRMHVGEVFVSAVPEPSSVGLVGLGAFGLFARRRRRA